MNIRELADSLDIFPHKTGKKQRKTITTAKHNPKKILAKYTLGPFTIGRMLRTERLCEEIPQKEFAERLGISVSHLCDIEKGRKQVSSSRAAQFAKVLGLSERQFVRVALQDLLAQEGFPGLEVTLAEAKKVKPRRAVAD